MTKTIDGKVSIYKGSKDVTGAVISISKALDRIRTGKSKETIEKIRTAATKDDADEIKKTLPGVCFSGRFSQRLDDRLIEHSGYIVLDFDDVVDLSEKRSELVANKFISAVWVSPRGTGLKAMVRIADPAKHLGHFAALRSIFPDLDKSGRNVSRLCFESYDPDLYFNPDADIFTSVETQEVITQTTSASGDHEIFQNLVKWMSSKGDAFREGERNHFVFKLAASCCRFGILEESCYGLIMTSVVPDSSFSQKECRSAIRSAYKANRAQWNSAEFSNEKLITKTTRKEVDIIVTKEDAEDMSKEDVIYAEEVSEKASEIYLSGYKTAQPIGVPELDKHFKRSKGELTGISGIGNYGKSAFLKWEIVFRMVKFGEKVAIFTPEELPAEQFYHDLVEIYWGCDCTPNNLSRPPYEAYMSIYKMIGEHVFMVYPKDVSPTPDYVKEVFLSLIIKFNVDRVIIDPFNQMSNDYSKGSGRSDKYLETFLSDCTRFARKNNVCFDIVIHPTKMRKGDDGNYPCPEVFDLNDGAMWNNKLDNILIYHRPFAQTSPDDPTCEFHSKKIKKQKIVGQKGFFTFQLDRRIRRFTFNGVDYLQLAIDGKYYQGKMDTPVKSTIKPNKNWTDSKEIKEQKEDEARQEEYKEAWDW